MFLDLTQSLPDAPPLLASGGGIIAATLITITAVDLVSTNILRVTFDAPVTAGDFANGDFATNPDTATSSSIDQFNPTTLTLNYGPDIDDQVSLTYSGAVAGILTPQTVPIT